jgi:dihydroflavonol-4-reductase
MTKSRKIAITGGSGHLGTCLIQQLLSQGFLVNALFTNDLPSENHKNLTWIQGDITDKKAAKNLIEDCTAIIHAAGIISIGNKDTEEIYRVNVNGTETVVDACIKKGGIKLIHISSSNAVKECEEHEVFNEDRPYKTKNDFAYSYTKATAEKVVLNAVDNNNLEALIIRPTSIVGSPDPKPSLLGQTILDLHHQKMPAITTGGYNLVDVKDVSQTIINAIEKGKNGNVYLVGGEFMLIKHIAEASTNGKVPMQISLNLLLFLMPLINLYQKAFQLKWPITKESIKTLKLAPKNMDFSKAIIELNHNYRPAKESIQDFIEWSKKQ